MINLILLLTTLVSAQVSENPNLHARFTQPGGWVADPPLFYGTNGATMRVTRAGLQPVTLTIWKYHSSYATDPIEGVEIVIARKRILGDLVILASHANNHRHNK